MNDKLDAKLQQKTHDEIQELLAGAISKNLSIKELAGKIWLGAVQNNFAELTMSSMMFEKANSLSPSESCELVQHLVKLTLCGDTEAIKRALTLLCDGLIANNKTEKNEIPRR